MATSTTMTTSLDIIYPRWSTFVKPVVKPKGKKKLDFHNAHAAARKDVEGYLGYCKPLSEDRLDFGIKRFCGIS
jgi:hypothetical protein